MSLTHERRINIFEELWYDLPDCNDILPSVSNIHDQVWVRPNLKRELTEDEVTLEYKRRREGVWFMNKGEPTYLTGDHYFYLTFCRFSFGYPTYRDVDRRFFYAWDLAVKDERCLGLIRAKFRRTGATSQGEAIMLNAGTMTEGVNLGIVSETSKKAATVFRGIVDVMQTIPEVFMPALESRDRPKKEISFREPSQVMNGKKKERSKLSLNTTIDYGATTINSYDGSELYRLLVDEGAKWAKDTPFGEFFEIHRTCLVHGGEVFGKMYVPSTINEMTKGGAEYKKVWEDSSPYLVDEKGNNILEQSGSTSSGLYRLFIPSYDGLQGFIDKWGYSVIDSPTEEQIQYAPREMFAKLKIGAKEYLKQELDKRKDPNRKAEFQRQFPTNIREAFSINNKLSPFDINKLNQQYEFNEANPNLVVRGNFVWKGERGGDVEWHPNESGRFLVSWLPSVENRNQYTERNNKRYPKNDGDGCFGLDPFSHRLVADNRRSNAALYGLKFATPADPIPFFFLEYIFRAATPREMTEDCAKACIFYGMPLLGETNKSEWMNNMIAWNLEGYLMKRPYETQSEWTSKQKQDYGLPNQTEDVRGKLVGYMQNFIYDYVGYNEEGQMGRLYFNRLIEDLLLFDPTDKWTDFDAFVGAVFAIAGSKRYTPRKVTQPFIPQVPSYKRRAHPFH